MRNIKISGAAAAASFFIWWWSFLLFFPLERMKDGYPSIVGSPMWVPVNMLQVAGVIALACFMIEYTNAFYAKTKASGIFKLLMLIGVAGFCGVAFYETFLWPVIAANAPALLDISSGPIYTSLLFNASTIVVILAYWAGSLYLGIGVWKKNRIVSIIYTAGVSLHCLGYMAGPVRYVVQSAGFTLFAAGLIAIAFLAAKRAPHTNAAPESLAA